MKIHGFLTGLVLTFFLLINGFGQLEKCDDFDRNVKYKVLFENKSTAESEIFLEVYIGPERFTIESMLNLIERLRTEYCGFDSISVRFYDTKKIDKLRDPLPYPLLDWESKTPMRGFYDRDRRSNKQELGFRGKKKDKVITVIFNSDGYCVTEVSS